MANLRDMRGFVFAVCRAVVQQPSTFLSTWAEPRKHCGFIWEGTPLSDRWLSILQCYKMQMLAACKRRGHFSRFDPLRAEPMIMTPAVSHTVNLLARDAAIHTTLSRGESLGLALDVEAGLASTIAAAVILILIFVSHIYFLVNIFLLKTVLSAGCV